MSPSRLRSDYTLTLPERATLSVRRFLMLSPAQANFSVRGFIPCPWSRRQALEAIGETFIDAYNTAIRTGTPYDLIDYVSGVPIDLRGFAAEGASMGTVVADALPFRRACFPLLSSLLEREFTYLVHVGAGWALARVAWRRRQILASLDPIHCWLAFDGLGFHDCYFSHQHVLSGWRRERIGYAGRSYDQGIGRALWFVCGGSVLHAGEMIRKLAPERRYDLWSGLGLAMAYAGQAEESDFELALKCSGDGCYSYAQGIAFACEARARAGHVPLHTEIGARAIGFEINALAGLVQEARRCLSNGDHAQPLYEAWRQSVSRTVADTMTPQRIRSPCLDSRSSEPDLHCAQRRWFG